MNSYAAFLRGIMPQNPNMRNDKLRGVFESLGFTNVRTVIGSGNVLFETDLTDTKQMEAMIEEALPAQLDFNSTTIIRSRDELLMLMKRNPFKGVEPITSNYTVVTFCKTKPHFDFKLPYQPPDKSYRLLSLHDRDICTVIDMTGARTPDFMTWLEKLLSKDITTRTYKTLGRVIDKLDKN